ncbi:putative methyltransferase-domain-containing protein [Paraphoma chrysanthemicola]|uniref:25S rRNA adenine-N(1) methyltransferase n=1 Tax=Paraphoma chrysanthemicola TaxID=798071 RepID=A0A8K0R6X9_9PLEO|nr:putative methyltransferase-domain-containing protein [Paraphoma chrysanthemicola]
MAIKKRQKSLASGRPPVRRPKERMTSERSRTIIRTHHRLQKEHAQALKQGDAKRVTELTQAIENNGGIKLYQAASKQGQAKDRGGDSSKVLVDWLQQLRIIDAQSRGKRSSTTPPVKCLEIGALSTDNEISRFPSMLQMSRIDLNSQESGIEKQDFMERPLPTTDVDRFDIISLSLVLNYVPDATGRGEMLKRITKFLRRPSEQLERCTTPTPLLFFVLPLPCVENSRYLDEPLLLQIMSSLGFLSRYSKKTSKLCYYLFKWTGAVAAAKVHKKKTRDAPGMNNFCIVME